MNTILEMLMEDWWRCNFRQSWEASFQTSCFPFVSRSSVPHPEGMMSAARLNCALRVCTNIFNGDGIF